MTEDELAELERATKRIILMPAEKSRKEFLTLKLIAAYRGNRTADAQETKTLEEALTE